MYGRKAESWSSSRVKPEWSSESTTSQFLVLLPRLSPGLSLTLSLLTHIQLMGFILYSCHENGQQVKNLHSAKEISEKPFTDFKVPCYPWLDSIVRISYCPQMTQCMNMHEIITVARVTPLSADFVLSAALSSSTTVFYPLQISHLLYSITVGFPTLFSTIAWFTTTQTAEDTF